MTPTPTELREMIATASELPWVYVPDANAVESSPLPNGACLAGFKLMVCEHVAKEDASLIVASVNAMPALLDRLDALERDVDQLRKTFTHIHVRDHDNGDRCKKCGLDLRDPIHTHYRQETNRD